MLGRRVYYFGAEQVDGAAEAVELLGGKGAHLAEMVRLGIPVPPGFTITTEVCRYFHEHRTLPPDLTEELEAAISRIEGETGREFGAPYTSPGGIPLLLSVRSGAPVSMPGMMDTVLNLGLNRENAMALAVAMGNPQFAYDSYRRFIEMYGEIVLGLPRALFEERVEGWKYDAGVRELDELDPTDLLALADSVEILVRETSGEGIPVDPWEQLERAIEAVFDSWHNERAQAYRRVHGIDDELGTGVTVMTMVFGNLGEDSGTGVVFTRDPSNGENRIFGEFLSNAQGEELVAGVEDPLPISDMALHFPELYLELEKICGLLEAHYSDMQDIEFTFERGHLYILQTRTGKRTATAAVRIAVDLADEGLIDREEALLRVSAEELDRLLHHQIEPGAEAALLGRGLPASPGAVSGRVVFDSEEAITLAGEGERVILVRGETSPDDFEGMVAASGILTTRGGMTSHAAVVARGMGRPCVVGAGEITIDQGARRLRSGDLIVEVGEWITIDGSEGQVLVGKVPTVEPEPSAEFERLLSWADEYRRLGIRANADTPEDAARALEFGAEGIGLCRTEHMFFGEDRLALFREMILAPDTEGRASALDRLLPLQREDFAGIFRVMAGLPVTIRLLDPPLHEFLPSSPAEVSELGVRLGLTPETLAGVIEEHRESNPMLGHRGVRLGITRPEITEMQARAIFEAGIGISEEGLEVRPEIMVPLIATDAEFIAQRGVIDRVAQEVFEAADRELEYLVGTMIELPRAALQAGKIARHADFFSFGTNDLTQTTFGISRDDAATFLPRYVEEGLLEEDPFQVLDQEGVGRLISIAVEEGRTIEPELQVGVCGEHGGEPHSVDFFEGVGLDYVSCSPYRIPVARLAAAQARISSCRQGAPEIDSGHDEKELSSETARATSSARRAPGEPDPDSTPLPHDDSVRRAEPLARHGFDGESEGSE